MVSAIHHRQLNTAALEADVMRFMAIIAFCLIAMMTLVKEVEPLVEPEPATSSMIELMAVIDEQPAADPAPKVAELITVSKVTSPKKPALEVILSRASTIKTNDSLTSIPARPIVKTEPTVNAGNKDKAQSIARAQSKRESVDTVNAEDLDNETNSLTFRFDSDKTFLHLIATDRLQLYAHTAGGFLAMDDDFNITKASPSGELFEVMAQSIPAKIKSIFNRKNRSPVYLVALPVETRRDLSRFLGSTGKNSTTGVLIIHRNGRISHEI